MQVGSATSAASVSAGKAREGLSIGYDAFLKLLLAQMKNQDPTKPMDSSTYVSQLATLSNLEQVVQQSEKLDALLESGAASQALAIIGREIVSADGALMGRVVSARVTDAGLVATLESGAEMLVERGVRFGI